jgi:hypothetical protein
MHTASDPSRAEAQCRINAEEKKKNSAFAWSGAVFCSSEVSSEASGKTLRRVLLAALLVWPNLKAFDDETARATARSARVVVMMLRATVDCGELEVWQDMSARSPQPWTFTENVFTE